MSDAIVTREFSPAMKACKELMPRAVDVRTSGVPGSDLIREKIRLLSW